MKTVLRFDLEKLEKLRFQEFGLFMYHFIENGDSNRASEC